MRVSASAHGCKSRSTCRVNVYRSSHDFQDESFLLIEHLHQSVVLLFLDLCRAFASVQCTEKSACACARVSQGERVHLRLVFLLELGHSFQQTLRLLVLGWLRMGSGVGDVDWLLERRLDRRTACACLR